MFLALWVAGLLALRAAGLDAVFFSLVALLDVVLVFLILSGDVRLN